MRDGVSWDGAGRCGVGSENAQRVDQIRSAVPIDLDPASLRGSTNDRVADRILVGPLKVCRCDQARLVRRKGRCGCLHRNTVSHLAGANPVRPKPARQVGSEPCDRTGRDAGGRRGRQRAWRCVGARTRGPWEVSLENIGSLGVFEFDTPGESPAREDSNVAPVSWQEGRRA